MVQLQLPHLQCRLHHHYHQQGLRHCLHPFVIQQAARAQAHLRRAKRTVPMNRLSQNLREKLTCKAESYFTMVSGHYSTFVDA